MSGSEDSETAEWEREQMLRGTQSRARQQRQNLSSNQRSTSTTASSPKIGDQRSDVINASLAKRHVQNDIEQVEREIEDRKRNIGSTRLDIVRSRKRVEAMMRQIEKLESSKVLFSELQRLRDPGEILELFEKHRQMILKLPDDQREMVDLLEGRMRETQTPMVVELDD